MKYRFYVIGPFIVQRLWLLTLLFVCFQANRMFIISLHFNTEGIYWDIQESPLFTEMYALCLTIKHEHGRAGSHQNILYFQ